MNDVRLHLSGCKLEKVIEERNGFSPALAIQDFNTRKGWAVVARPSVARFFGSNLRSGYPTRFTALAALLLATATSLPFPTVAEDWRGIVLAQEDRCSEYHRSDYRYSQSLEKEIVVQMKGRIYSPYSGMTFPNTGHTDIEHIVAVSEAHDSGLCSESLEVRRRFANDLRNLTLASPELNRFEKIGFDAAEWLPPRNRCWYVGRILEIKKAYGLTVDRKEAQAIDRVMAGCTSTDIVFYESSDVESGGSKPGSSTTHEALQKWDDNGNGRITCKEARNHGIAPVPKDHLAYQFMRDGDGDGVVCE